MSQECWSDWIECPFKASGDIDANRADNKVPNEPGVYAIATKTGSRYNVQYVGRSGRSMWKRVMTHLSGKGNKVIATLLAQKKSTVEGVETKDKVRLFIPSDPLKALYVAYWPTRDHKLVEALHISADDRPVCNIIRGARLPDGLHTDDMLQKIIRSYLDAND